MSENPVQARAPSPGPRLEGPLPFVTIGLLTLLAYGRVLAFAFFHDDLFLVRPVAQWEFLAAAPTGYYWRPLWTLWMSVQYELFGLSPAPMHAASLVLHFVNACLVYVLLARAGAGRAVALATVALWSVMAGNAYPVAWISSCNDLTALMSLLVATHLWVSLPPGRALGLARSAVASGVWLAGMLTKEVGVAWPVAAAGYQVWRSRRGARDRAARGAGAAALVPPVVAFLLYFGLRFAALGRSGGFAASDLPPEGSHAEGSGPLVMIAGRTIHYLEALFYNFLPLDLFPSEASLAAGAAIGLAMAVTLLLAWRGVTSATGRPILIALAWIALFSVHGALHPHPRTLYVPTLGAAFVICHLAAASGAFRRLPAQAALTAYLALHVLLGQGAVDLHAPTSFPTLVRSSRYLLEDDPRITPEKQALLRAQLAHTRTESLARFTPEEELRLPWRELRRKAFDRLVRRGRR